MRVIPSRTVLECLPGVCRCLTRRGRALGNGDDTIVLVGKVLTDTVPVDSFDNLVSFRVPGKDKRADTAEKTSTRVTSPLYCGTAEKSRNM